MMGVGTERAELRSTGSRPSVVCHSDAVLFSPVDFAESVLDLGGPGERCGELIVVSNVVLDRSDEMRRRHLTHQRGSDFIDRRQGLEQRY